MKTFIKKHVKSYKVLGHAHYFVVYAYIIKETEPDLRGSILLFNNRPPKVGVYPSLSTWDKEKY